MLGRIGTGAAVAALPLAVLLWAGSASGRTAAGIAAAVILAAVLAVTYAPWIPRARKHLPGARRIATLEEFWVEGHRIAQRDVYADSDLDGLISQREDWTRRAADWIGAAISRADSERFRRPGVTDYQLGMVYSHKHGETLATIHHQLEVLIELRDEQERRMR